MSRFLCLVTSLLCLGSLCLRADDIPYDYRYRPRGNRIEGIRETIDTAFPARVELLSATMSSDSVPATDESGTATAAFYLDRERRVSLVVRYPSSNYWMESIDEESRRIRTWAAGLNLFTWPDEIIRHIEKTPEELLALARVSYAGSAMRVVPVLLSGSAALPEEIEVDEYMFAVRPDRDVDLVYTIRPVDGEPIVAEPPMPVYAGQILPIRWRPGREVAEGEYVLTVASTVPGVEKEEPAGDEVPDGAGVEDKPIPIAITFTVRHTVGTE